MYWRALLLTVMAALVFSPISTWALCSAPTACGQESSCCGHCQCTPEKSCQVSQPTPVDQFVVLNSTEVDACIQTELFRLAAADFPASLGNSRALARLPEAPPPDNSPPQAVLCLWLI